MGWPVCNTTLEDMRLRETPIWHGYTYHQFGLGLSAIFAAIAVLVSFFLIAMHATHYLRPNEQRHIIRILLMVPVYAAVSFLSFLYYRHSVYFEVLRDCYEAFAIASFFSLLCAYIAEDLHRQKQYFRTITPKNWLWPMAWFQKCCGGDRGCLRTPKSGLTWFNVIWVAVFQYCFIRVAMTVVAVVPQVFDRYCLESLNPAFAHIWVMVIEAVAVTIAMYCLIQFYAQIKADIAQHSPLQKIIAIKLVIFLSFWQTIVISFLTSSGAVQPSDTFQTPDIKIGIPAMLLCIEMALFAIFHLFAFSWRPYILRSQSFSIQPVADSKSTPRSYQGGFLGSKAIVDAFNPWDLIKAVGRAAKWLFSGHRHRHNDSSYDSTQLSVSGSRKQRTDSEIDLSSSLEASTSYKPHGQPASLADEDQTLLSASAPMPRYAPRFDSLQTSPSPYRQDGPDYFDAGDIGIAQTTADQSRYYMAPNIRQNELEQASYATQRLDGTMRYDSKYEANRPLDPRQPRAG